MCNYNGRVPTDIPWDNVVLQCSYANDGCSYLVTVPHTYSPGQLVNCSFRAVTSDGASAWATLPWQNVPADSEQLITTPLVTPPFMHDFYGLPPAPATAGATQVRSCVVYRAVVLWLGRDGAASGRRGWCGRRWLRSLATTTCQATCPHSTPCTTSATPASYCSTARTCRSTRSRKARWTLSGSPPVRRAWTAIAAVGAAQSAPAPALHPHGSLADSSCA